MSVLEIEAALVATAGVLAALLFLFRKVWIGARLAVHAADLIVGDGPERPGFNARLESVEREVKTNGGGSMKDSVKRNEVALDRLGDAVVQVAQAVAALGVTAEEAKERAAEAVDEAAKLAAALGRADAAGRQERARQQESLELVMDAFLSDRREQHNKTIAYIDALKGLGIDLTAVTDELEANPWPGDDPR